MIVGIVRAREPLIRLTLLRRIQILQRSAIS